MSVQKYLFSLKDIIRDIAAIALPRHCAVCRRRLQSDERHICNKCLRELPNTEIRGRHGNVVERLFWGKINICRANAMLRYRSGSAAARPVVQLKYFDAPEMGIALGRMMASDLMDTDFMKGIDVIVPLPLAPSRQLLRGYNQSECLARGISEITGLPVDTRSVERIIDNPTQTHLDARERRENVAGIFRLSHPEALAGKHVLLVDDVLTTGASLLSCAEEIQRAGGVRFSVMTLYLAGRHPMVPDHPRRKEMVLNSLRVVRPLGEYDPEEWG